MDGYGGREDRQKSKLHNYFFYFLNALSVSCPSQKLLKNCTVEKSKQILLVAIFHVVVYTMLRCDEIQNILCKNKMLFFQVYLAQRERNGRREGRGR